MGTFDTEAEIHSPPQFLLMHGEEMVRCSKEDVRAAIAEMTEAHPGQFIDVYELRTCARLPVDAVPAPSSPIILPGAANEG